jgi:hypothetical protein
MKANRNEYKSLLLCSVFPGTKEGDSCNAMDAVNNKFGDFIVTFASLMVTKEKGHRVMSPA